MPTTPTFTPASGHVFDDADETLAARLDALIGGAEPAPDAAVHRLVP